MLSGPSVKALFFPMFSKWSNGGGGGASPLQQYQTCTWIQTESKDIFFYPLYIEGSRATQSRWDSVLSRVNQTSLPVCQVSLEGKKKEKKIADEAECRLTPTSFCHSSPAGRFSSILLINFIRISVTLSPRSVSWTNFTSTAIWT